MKHRHLQELGPLCPGCMTQQGVEHPLGIGWIARESSEAVLEGALRCSNEACQLEYPILDGVPILLPDARGFIAASLVQLVAREDLDEATEALLGECCGPGSAFDATRQRLGSYAWDHYAEFDPIEPQGDPRPGSIARLLERALGLLGDELPGPILDLGCATGRASFELARSSGALVLGVDLDFAQVQLAARLAARGLVRYPRRQSGLLYQRREFPLRFENAAAVDFWVCDATAPPFRTSTFGAVLALNVLDCVAAPLDLLRAARRVLAPGGALLSATPYEWTGAAALPETWIGGHSPRSADRGVSAAVLRALLTPGKHPASLEGIRIVGELDDVPWNVRMHERGATSYQLHVVAARVD